MTDSCRNTTPEGSMSGLGKWISEASLEYRLDLDFCQCLDRSHSMLNIFCKEEKGFPLRSTSTNLLDYWEVLVAWISLHKQTPLHLEITAGCFQLREFQEELESSWHLWDHLAFLSSSHTHGRNSRQRITSQVKIAALSLPSKHTIHS